MAKKKKSFSTPLTALEKLKSLNLLSQLSSDLQHQLGISDKTLTEFLISLAESHLKKSYKTVWNASHKNNNNTVSLGVYVADNVELASGFQETLKENGAEVPLGFVSKFLEKVANGSPRMDRFLVTLKAKRAKKAVQEEPKSSEGGGGVGGSTRLLSSYLIRIKTNSKQRRRLLMSRIM